MKKQRIYCGLLFLAFMLAGITNASTTNSPPTNKRTVVLKDGITQLCLDTRRNGELCQPVVESPKAGRIKKVIQTNDFEGAPYSWMAFTKNHVYICAAGNNPATQTECVRVKLDLAKIGIDKAQTQQLTFLFKAKRSGTDLDTLSSTGTKFAKAYAKIQGFLRLYANEKWLPKGAVASSKEVVTSNRAQESGIMTPLDLDCGGGGTDDCVEDGGGDVGDEGGGGGGGDYGGGYDDDDDWEEEVSGPGSNIDPVTGLPYSTVWVPAPLPVIPNDPSWCNMIGILCSAPTIPPPSPEWCETKRQECSEMATSLYVRNPESLDGTGRNYEQRWRLTVRNCLARFDCHQNF